jgi:hypothetical protein
MRFSAIALCLLYPASPLWPLLWGRDQRENTLRWSGYLEVFNNLGHIFSNIYRYFRIYLKVWKHAAEMRALVGVWLSRLSDGFADFIVCVGGDKVMAPHTTVSPTKKYFK